MLCSVHHTDDGHSPRAVGLSVIDGFITGVCNQHAVHYPFKFNRKGESLGMDDATLARYQADERARQIPNPDTPDKFRPAFRVGAAS